MGGRPINACRTERRPVGARARHVGLSTGVTRIHRPACRLVFPFRLLILLKKTLTGRIGPGGESLAAPRGVSDSESFRGCKQRPSKLFAGGLVFSRIDSHSWASLNLNSEFEEPSSFEEVGLNTSGLEGLDLGHRRARGNTAGNQMLMQASSIESIRTVLWNHRTSLSSVLACFRTSILTVKRNGLRGIYWSDCANQHVVSLSIL